MFHAGTARDPEGHTVAAGGRVLAVTALGGDIGQAQLKAYQARPLRSSQLPQCFQGRCCVPVCALRCVCLIDHVDSLLLGDARFRSVRQYNSETFFQSAQP